LKFKKDEDTQYFNKKLNAIAAMEEKQRILIQSMFNKGSELGLIGR